MQISPQVISFCLHSVAQAIVIQPCPHPAFQGNIFTPGYPCLPSHPKALSAHVHPNTKVWRMAREVSQGHHPAITNFSMEPTDDIEERESKGKWRTGLSWKCREDSSGRSRGVKSVVSPRARMTRAALQCLSLREGTVSSNIPGTRDAVDTQKRMQKGWGWFRGEDKALREEWLYQ